MTVLVDLTLRTSAIFLAALLITAAMRRATAATRHLVWTLAVVTVLMLPLLTTVLPEWRVLPAGSADAVRQMEVAPMGGESVGGAKAPPYTAGRRFDAASSNIALLAIWAVVTCALLLRLVGGIRKVHRLCRHARPADARCRDSLDKLVAEVSVRRPIRLLINQDISTPMTWGGLRPLLLLPEDAGQWSDDRLRAVLLHELAHVRRADWLTHALSHVACAFHWFNPLAWVAMRAMTRERERACDDFVIARGAITTDYAQHLLDIARGNRGHAMWGVAPAMARPSELEGRLLAILTPRRRQPRWLTAPAITVAAIVVAFSIAAATPHATPQTPEPQPRSQPRLSMVSRVQEADAAPQERSERNTRHKSLARALDDASEDVREKAAMGLALDSETDVVDLLLRALKDPSSQVREKAAIGLAFRRQPKVTDALLEAVKDPDSQVREKVVFALGFSGDPRATAALAAAAEDPDEQVREKAVMGLALAPALERK